jgi:hypothetical protein
MGYLCAAEPINTATYIVVTIYKVIL